MLPDDFDMLVLSRGTRQNAAQPGAAKYAELCQRIYRGGGPMEGNHLVVVKNIKIKVAIRCGGVASTL